MSSVINDWLIVWNDSLDDEPRQELYHYIERLSRSRGTTADEVTRQWAVVDWTVRVLAPLWLKAAGLPVLADQLACGAAIIDKHEFGATAPAVEAAWLAAQRAHDRLCSVVATPTQPDGRNKPQRPPWRPVRGDAGRRRIGAWAGLADGTRAALDRRRTLLGPASAAVGYRDVQPEQRPFTWRATTEAVTEANALVAWRAAHQVVNRDDWSWHIPADEAWNLAYGMARTTLEPVEAATHAAAHQLLDQLLKVTERGP